MTWRDSAQRWESASLRYGPATDSSWPSLSYSFQRHPRAKTSATHRGELWWVSASSPRSSSRGRELTEATPPGLERSSATCSAAVSGYYRHPIVPDKPLPVGPEGGLRRLLAACAGKSFGARQDTAMITFLLDTAAHSGEIADLAGADPVRVGLHHYREQRLTDPATPLRQNMAFYSAWVRCGRPKKPTKRSVSTL
jgi:integrase